jgi:hypothetical protein
MRSVSSVPVFFTPSFGWVLMVLGPVLLPLPRLLGDAVVTNCTPENLAGAVARGGTVTFACDGTIQLTNTIAIDRNITLDGAGHNLTIDGGNQVRLFQVKSNVNFSLLLLTLARGQAFGTNSGGFGRNAGPGHGGAIFNAGGTLSVVGCVFLENSAVGGQGGNNGGSGGAGDGGAIYSQGTATIRACRFLTNRSYGGSAYGFISEKCGEGRGGAIYHKSGHLILEDCFFFGNAVAGGEPYAGYVPNGDTFGGGIFAGGGQIQIANCAFIDNRALLGTNQWRAGGLLGGGALCVGGGEATITATEFSTNRAASAPSNSLGSGTGAPDANGGAILNLGNLQITNCTFAGNSVIGGAVLSSIYIGNSSLGAGGGLYSGGTAIIVGSSFLWNSAMGGPGTSYTQGSGGGAGQGGAILTTNSISLINCSFYQNSAIGGDAFAFRKAGGDGLGGAFCTGAGLADIRHVTLSGNSAFGGAGIGLRSAPGQALGGALYNSGGSQIRLQATIVANSSSGGDCWGTITDLGNNICSDATCNFSAAGSRNNTNPVLGFPGYYGGSTPTFPLLAGSPAIDAAEPTNCPGTDQRGIQRPFGSRCDVGAFESSPPYFIAGTISSARPMHAIAVAAGTIQTNMSEGGGFILSGFNPGTYTVTPASSNFLFMPSARTVTFGPDIAGVDFKGYESNTLSIEQNDSTQFPVIFAGQPSQTYRIQVSTNLKDWNDYATNLTDGKGFFEFSITNLAMRSFFRAGKP